jgi:hypothetical protein
MYLPSEEVLSSTTYNLGIHNIWGEEEACV